MVRIQRSAILAYSAQQMFDLVNDVEAYPEFVPYCVACELLLSSDVAIEARLDLAKGPLKQSFTTRNLLSAASEHEPNYSMHMQLIDGPFTEFSGMWRFEVLDEKASRVSLDMNFDLKAGFAGFALKKLFEKLAGRLVDAFAQRAKEIYG